MTRDEMNWSQGKYMPIREVEKLLESQICLNHGVLPRISLLKVPFGIPGADSF